MKQKDDLANTFYSISFQKNFENYIYKTNPPPTIKDIEIKLGEAIEKRDIINARLDFSHIKGGILLHVFITDWNNHIHCLKVSYSYKAFESSFLYEVDKLKKEIERSVPGNDEFIK